MRRGELNIPEIEGRKNRRGTPSGSRQNRRKRSVMREGPRSSNPTNTVCTKGRRRGRRRPRRGRRRSRRRGVSPSDDVPKKEAKSILRERARRDKQNARTRRWKKDTDGERGQDREETHQEGHQRNPRESEHRKSEEED